HSITANRTVPYRRSLPPALLSSIRSGASPWRLSYRYNPQHQGHWLYCRCKELQMNKRTTLLCVTLGLFPVATLAQSGSTSSLGPVQGEREFTLSGTGSSDKDFDSSSIGVSADIGWYRSREL